MSIDGKNSVGTGPGHTYLARTSKPGDAGLPVWTFGARPAPDWVLVL